MSLAQARKLLREAGEERLYLNCLLGVRPGTFPSLREALKLCDAALRKRRGDAGAWSLKARVLSALGRAGEARRALDRAARLKAPSAEALAWRAESWLLDGQVQAASRDAVRALEEDPAWPWARFLRAVCLLQGGGQRQAAEELGALLDHPAAGAAARGLLALAEAQDGRPERALPLLDRIVEERPSGWAHAFRALVRRGQGDLPGSLSDLNAAERLEPSAWTYSHRADVLYRMGFYRDALEDLKTLARLLPASPEPLLQAANIYFDQAFYEEALGALDAAIRLAPDDVRLLTRRAKILFVLNRLAGAEADLARAARLSPDEQTRAELLLMRILRGRHASALKELKAGAVGPVWTGWLEGVLRCRRGEYAEARESFARAASLGEGAFARRMRYFSLVARVLGEGGGAGREKPPRLYLCGIGIRHPYQTTVEILRALARCDVLYNNIGDPQIMEFLSLFPGKVKPVRRVWGGTAMGRAEGILAELKRPGGTAGFITRIHPFIYRRIANDLVGLCRSAGVSFRSFGAVSLTEVLWGLAASDPGSEEVREGRQGLRLRVFDIDFLDKNPDLLDPRVGTVVYCIADARRRKELCALLRARLAPRRRCYVLAGSGDKEDAAVPAPVEELEEALLKADDGALIYVPATGGSL